MSSERSQHSELVERVRQATASDIPPAPWTWDSEWDSLKGADGRYVLCTRLDFHGRDEEGDNFTSHLDLLKGEDLIALAPEMATALVSLFEQLETLQRIADNFLPVTDPLDMWLCIDGDYVRPATSQEAAFVLVLKGPKTPENEKTTAAVAGSESSPSSSLPASGHSSEVGRGGEMATPHPAAEVSSPASEPEAS